MPIRTSQLKVELDTAAVAEKYDVFKIETTGERFKCGAGILDASQTCNSVCAVYFESGRCFYVLMRKEEENKRRLRSVLLETEGGEWITVREMRAWAVERRVLISLLLYALNTCEIEWFRFNNLTGHLCCSHPVWMKRDDRAGKNTILQIPCLELYVTEQLRLRMEVRTFLSERLRKAVDFNKRRYEQQPKYVIAANHTLRRKLSSDTEDGFFLGRIKKGRTEVPFLDIQNLEKFKASKMGVVACVLALFNKKYEGVCNLSFQAIEEYVVLDSPKAIVRENEKAVRTLLEERKIRVVDLIGDEISGQFCRDVKRLLKEKYGVVAAIGKRRTKASLNLCVLHEAQHYEGKGDPYRKSCPEEAVQHITLEKFMGNAAGAISSVVHELLIKSDIQNRHFSLFDWSALGMGESVSFGICRRICDVPRFFFMRIEPNGTFVFDEKKPTPAGEIEYAECVDIFADSKDVAGVIRFANGDINVIRETSWFTVPEIEKIHQELEVGNTYLRGKERRQELLPSITDIKLFKQDGKQCYFVGIIGEGMRTTVNHGAVIRTVEPYEGSALRFEELLPLMNVTFVRNGRLTVIPFPFKYLREYITMVEEGLR